MINQKNKLAFSIGGILLCISYVYLMGLMAAYVSSKCWEWCGGNRSYYYVYDYCETDELAVILYGGIALIYVIPWLVYFRRIGKRGATDFRPVMNGDKAGNVHYVILSLFLIVFYCVAFWLPYFIVYENYSENVPYYVDLELYPWRMASIAGVAIGTLVYIPMSIRILVRNKKQLSK